MLEIGVIGIQGFGRTSLDLLQKRPDACVTAICDVNELAARQLDIPHLMTIVALASRVDVFCEKLLALTAAEAQEMVATAERLGRVLICNYSHRSRNSHGRSCASKFVGAAVSRLLEAGYESARLGREVNLEGNVG